MGKVISQLGRFICFSLHDALFQIQQTKQGYTTSGTKFDHAEANQLIYTSNKLSDFYIMGTLELKSATAGELFECA